MAGKVTKTLSIKDVKVIQLEIMDDIHDFCMRNSIRYSLTGGTLIGAIRHGGYIPWDDDIDIMLPRPDYERFLRNYNSYENEVLNLMASDTCVETFAKVSRKDTFMVDKALGRNLWGINVDLFPVDGFPADKTREHFDTLQTMNGKLGVYCPFYKTVSRDRTKWFLKYLLKRLLYFYPHSFAYIKDELNNKLTQYSFGTSPYAALFCGGDGWCEVMRKGIFESYTNVQFEGRSYLAVSEYDTYLRNVFGDYMKLPPESQRVPKHDYNYYSS